MYMHRLDNNFNSLYPSVFFPTLVNMFVLDKVFLVKAMRYVQYSEKKCFIKNLICFTSDILMGEEMKERGRGGERR